MSPIAGLRPASASWLARRRGPKRRCAGAARDRLIAGVESRVASRGANLVGASIVVPASPSFRPLLITSVD
jgi:hypothetical protein